MISRINGILISGKPPVVVVEACGIGYEIDLPMSDFAELPEVGSNVILHTHLVIREDLHALYGFITQNSRDCFRQLIKVSGIGPRIALALLSTLAVHEISLAIESSDTATLCRTPGIGKKMAERMLLELKGKFSTNHNSETLSITSTARTSYSINTDIINALSSLGYNEKETAQVIKQLPKDVTDLSLGIKEALKLLNKHKSS